MGKKFVMAKKIFFKIIFKSICIFYFKTCIKSLASFFPIVIASLKYLKLKVV